MLSLQKRWAVTYAHFNCLMLQPFVDIKGHFLMVGEKPTKEKACGLCVVPPTRAFTGAEGEQGGMSRGQKRYQFKFVSI